MRHNAGHSKVEWLINKEQPLTLLWDIELVSFLKLNVLEVFCQFEQILKEWNMNNMV